MMALDLFCGVGGASMGLHRAGFEVVGIDIRPQPNYPFTFIQADALTPPVRLEDFDFVWASPPCQDHVRTPGNMKPHGTGHLLGETRSFLSNAAKTWCIENVPGAPMRADYLLCGCQFGLKRLRRTRLFETSWNGFSLMPPCDHAELAITVTGNGTPSGTYKNFGSLPLKAFQDAMGIDWASRLELSQSIPPAYSEFIGRAAMDYINASS